VKSYSEGLYSFGGATFDDTTIDEDGNIWSQVCKKCINKYEFNNAYLEDHGDGICGVLGCDCEETVYIDFPKEKEQMLCDYCDEIIENEKDAWAVDYNKMNFCSQKCAVNYDKYGFGGR
jgi:hypothetical protein